jgi:NCS1 family nucleobase:cation symporter-1
MGALGGILIADYWVLRRQQLLVADLFREQGAYAYRNGYNWRAVAALVLSVLPVIPGFLSAATTPGGRVANSNLFDQLYSYAWFVTFGLSFVLYLILSKGARGARG